ncbi:hypothetical protein [Alkalihalobacillus sp. AL-G]|uniref:hypothetical protein n=1 Tax=Alkalihalobacillus sp. AL-G TaxID=2926399 RepID=UPI00272BB97A|nr:hypothetical protein [Alkalihalobacillus sp. AL-G]WLD91749.1 hypothetical protein MOJ78_11925 [Alkalihalobacillus sp. AL-G]
MYERYKEIGSIYQTLTRLEQMTAEKECYSQTCELIRHQLQKAIAYETGLDVSMSQYSSFYPR